MCAPSPLLPVVNRPQRGKMGWPNASVGEQQHQVGQGQGERNEPSFFQVYKQAQNATCIKYGSGGKVRESPRVGSGADCRGEGGSWGRALPAGGLQGSAPHGALQPPTSRQHAANAAHPCGVFSWGSARGAESPAQPTARGGPARRARAAASSEAAASSALPQPQPSQERPRQQQRLTNKRLLMGERGFERGSSTTTSTACEEPGRAAGLATTCPALPKDTSAVPSAAVHPGVTSMAPGLGASGLPCGHGPPAAAEPRPRGDASRLMARKASY